MFPHLLTHEALRLLTLAFFRPGPSRYETQKEPRQQPQAFMLTDSRKHLTTSKQRYASRVY